MNKFMDDDVRIASSHWRYTQGNHTQRTKSGSVSDYRSLAYSDDILSQVSAGGVDKRNAMRTMVVSGRLTL